MSVKKLKVNYCCDQNLFKYLFNYQFNLLTISLFVSYGLRAIVQGFQ